MAAMGVAIPRLTPLALRARGLRTAARVKNQGFVCGLCQRQQEWRKFHSSPVSRLRRRNNNNVDDIRSAEKKEYQFSVDELDPQERADYEALPPAEQQAFRNERKEIYDVLTSSKAVAGFQAMTKSAIAASEYNIPYPAVRPKKVAKSLWNLGEVDRNAMGEDDINQGDDLTELGHAELEQHREMRHYARIAVWEMPLLSKLATPFTPPDLDHILRFRYTTYMGESHPAAKKIVLEFSPSDLPDLTPVQRTKLIKLVGVRYNPETDVVKMSSEMFETQAQNKRYLGDLVDTLMAEAKDTSDTFEDVPLDFRHHTFKRRVTFPEAWKATPGRIEELEAKRRERLQLEQLRGQEGKIVDGGEVLRLALGELSVQEESAVLIEREQGRERGGKRMGGKKMLR